MVNLTKKYWLGLILLILIILASYWFFNKFYPSQTGEWSLETENKLDNSIIPSSGWIDNSFWTYLDYPGKQKICLDINPKNKSRGESKFQIPITQAPKAIFYPQSGLLSDFFNDMTPAVVEENLRQGKPYFIGHLANKIVREGKDLFFLGENEKFLIPTKGIYNKHIHSQEIPDPTNTASSQPYANVLVNLPEGILLSDGKGVFVMSQGKLFLIRSPEVFESLGYKWENIKQMDNYEMTFNSYLSGNLIDFDSPHPNGTILRDNNELSLVWNEKLYRLTEEERLKYFPEQAGVDISHKRLNADCESKINSENIKCCIDNVDSRLNPPSYSPFMNTLSWDLSKNFNKDEIGTINWQSRVSINKENSFRRLNSLKNFVLYGLGILK